jgi:hypothetical protein
MSDMLQLVVELSNTHQQARTEKDFHFTLTILNLDDMLKHIGHLIVAIPVTLNAVSPVSIGISHC